MVLGDGYIYVARDKRWNNSYYSRIVIKHGGKQKEYIEYKAELLHKLLGGKKPKVCRINNNGYIGHVIVKNNKYFKTLRNKIYLNDIKTFSEDVLNMLTPHGIAIWYMDDGSLYPKKRNGKIHAYELVLCTYKSKKENQIIIDYFKNVYDINFTQVKARKYYRLRCGTKEARKFICIVKKYIIPSMQYKINISQERPASITDEDICRTAGK